MLYLEESYQQQQIARREQMKPFEQAMGVAKPTTANPKATQLPVGRQIVDKSSSTHSRTQTNTLQRKVADYGATAEIAENFIQESSQPLSLCNLESS